MSLAQGARTPGGLWPPKPSGSTPAMSKPFVITCVYWRTVQFNNAIYIAGFACIFRPLDLNTMSILCAIKTVNPLAAGCSVINSVGYHDCCRDNPIELPQTLPPQRAHQVTSPPCPQWRRQRRRRWRRRSRNSRIDGSAAPLAVRSAC